MAIRPQTKRSLVAFESLEPRRFMAGNLVAIAPVALGPVAFGPDQCLPADPVVVNKPAMMHVAIDHFHAPENIVRRPERLLRGLLGRATEDFVARYRNLPPGYGTQPSPVPRPKVIDDALRQILALTRPIEAQLDAGTDGLERNIAVSVDTD